MSNTGSLSRSEQEDLLHMFQLFDTEQTGTVSLMELKTVLEQVAKEDEDDSSNQQTQRGRRQALEKVLALPVFQNPRNDDQQLSKEEFVDLLTSTEPQGSSDLERVFELFDTDKKGYIDVEDLRRMAQDLGEESMGQEELEEMIQRAASSQQGRVTLEDLEAVLNHTLMA